MSLKIRNERIERWCIPVRVRRLSLHSVTDSHPLEVEVA